MSSDKLLRQTIEKQLLHDHQLSAFNIDVETLNGLVTLRGRVPTARAKLAAHELAAFTPGCRDVVNELVVVPAQGITDTDIAESVRDSLDNHSAITKEAIAIQVDGGVVTLSGAVGSQEEYTVAEDLARSAQGVRDVQNLLIIDRDAQYDDESLQLEIKSAIAAVPELRDADINVAVSGDLIVLSGHVQDWRQKERAGEVALGVRPWRLRNDLAVPETPSVPEI